MRVTTLATLLWCLTSPANAEPMPPPPEGGLMVITEGPCRDIATQAQGYCVMSSDVNGNIYVMFALDGELVEIRKVVGDTYEVVWTRTPGIDA